MFGTIPRSVRYFRGKSPVHGDRKGWQNGLSNRLLFRTYRVLTLLILLIFTTGCVNDEDRQSEIRNKVVAGEYEEAARLAREYFADDKPTLLIALEYVAFQKTKALKEAYKNCLIIEDVNWSTDRSGATKVTGKLLNKGNKTITGYGIKVVCRQEGKVVHEARARWVAEIGPGEHEDFECIITGFVGCEGVAASVEDLGLKD